MTNVVAKHIANPELEIFHALTDAMKDEVKEWLRIIERIRNSGLSLEKAAKVEAARSGGKRGRSDKNIKRMVRRFRKEGWQCCINGSKKKGADKCVLPIPFIEYWADLCLDHQRGKIAACRNELIRRWQDENNVIPGYGSWRQWWAKQRPGVYFESCPPDLPTGWSYDTLNRNAPKIEEMDLARFGIFAGLKHQPHILRTRVGLRPLEWVAFDDVETDFMITVPGVDRPVRLAALVAKDVATDMWLRFVLRPAIPRADGTKDGLKKSDMKRLIAGLIMHYGYPADYTMNLVFERGTATLPPADIRALGEITGGMVVSHPTNMITGKVLMSGFADKATGSARSKGWIETGFNKFHNEAAFVKGQKGLSWEKAPMELETRTKHAVALLKAGQQLSGEQRLQELIPFVDIYEAQQTFNDILHRINSRHDHHCEGFEEQPIWRLAKGDPWKPAHESLSFPPAVRSHFLWKKQMESPIERLGRLLIELTFERVPDCALPQILAAHRTVTVAKHQIKITVSGRTYTFFDRDCLFLANDAEYLAYYDDVKMDYIYLTDGDGAFKCRLKRVDKVRQGDLDGMKVQMADTKHQLNTVINRINSRDSRVEKTRRAIANNEKAIEIFQDMDAINIAPNTSPGIANATDVTSDLTESQEEIYQERRDEVAREERDLSTEISDEEREAVLVHRPDQKQDFSEEEIAGVLERDRDPEPDYSELI